MSKIKEDKKEIKNKFEIKAFKENFLKGEMYHGILANPKEINKLNILKRQYYLNFFIIKINYFLFYMIIQVYIIVLVKIKKYSKLIKN